MTAPRLSFIALWLATAAFGGQLPAFRTETRLIVLHATVRNGRGALVTDLNQTAFSVFENGRRQPISLFRRDDVPVSLGLVIDNSGSMRRKRPNVEAAALAFARASNSDDELFVVNFADKARIDVPFTSSVGVLEAGIARVDSIGGTAMRDAIAMAEEYLAGASRDRKALLVVTDGNDNASLVEAERIERQAQQRDIVVYAIGLLGEEEPGRAKHARRDLERLTQATGGASYFPATIADVDTVALEIARQIRSQYTIAYAPIDQTLDGSYRRIEVAAKGSELLTVRTRAGYRATPDVLGPRTQR